MKFARYILVSVATLVFLLPALSQAAVISMDPVVVGTYTLNNGPGGFIENYSAVSSSSNIRASYETQPLLGPGPGGSVMIIGSMSMQRKFNLEFALSGLPSGAIIQSATLSWNETTDATGIYPRRRRERASVAMRGTVL